MKKAKWIVLLLGVIFSVISALNTLGLFDSPIEPGFDIVVSAIFIATFFIICAIEGYELL